ncbi:hypothetical protein [Thermococcus camini]|uniref:Transglutaminase-like domain-containing protein n=1 Tax=Thermococcus camini TaxID=2016373 RepID=A0A7G2DAH8_9EURY|nr:hypothetical protein [Thermococcus camini]CAD5244988.1 conserved protein of unknown function [Thermococcus camini]
MVRRELRLVLRPVAGVLLLFLLLSNVAVTFLPIKDKGEGLERVFLAPIKLVEYRRSNEGNVTTPSLPNPFKKREESPQRPPWVRFSPEELERDLNNRTLSRYLDDIINRSVALIRGMGEKPTPPLVRGTAYMLLLDRVNYVYDSRLDLPSYTVTHGGVCSDWTLVDYALIRRINLRYNITAKYFFVHTRAPFDVGHAFLAVHYPDGHWEAYDWFATTYLHVSYGRYRFKVLRVDRDEWVIGWFPADTAKAVRFSSLEEMLSVYSMEGGYLDYGYHVTLYELPSFNATYDIRPFQASEEARAKIDRIKAEMMAGIEGELRYNSYTVKVRGIGKGTGELIDAEFKDDLVVLHIKLYNVSAPIEVIPGERSTAVLVDRENAVIEKWRGVRYFGRYPAYDYLLLTGDVSEIKIGIPYRNPMYYFREFPWRVTFREYIGKDGVTVLLWEGRG